MRFKQFLEATGDKTVDAMITKAKIDADASIEFGKKLSALVDEFPDLLDRQRELEKWVSAELKKIRQIPTRALQAHLKELKPIAAEYREDTNPLELLYFTASSKDKHSYRYGQDPDDDNELSLQDVADAFMSRHKDEVKAAVAKWLDGFEQLKTAANNQKWPTRDWRRHTKFDAEYYHAKNIAGELSHWFK